MNNQPWDKDMEAKELIDSGADIEGFEETIIDRQQKHIEKQNRQQLKIQCLEAALQHASGKDATEQYIVDAAKAFYAFVRT